MKILIPFILLFVTFQSTIAYSAPKCGVEVLKKFSLNMDSLTEDELNLFFGSFSPKCGANVEFSEWSNELLFEALLKHSELFITTLSKYNKSFIKKALVALESPVHDGIDLSSTYAAVSETKSNSSTKDSLLSTLSKAGKKSGLTLK